MTEKTQAIRAYAQARANTASAERDEESARHGVDAALSVLDGRLRDAMQSVLSEFEEEYGFQPAEIDISMLDKTCIESQWNEYTLAMVSSKYWEGA